jgi:hypothetical protein
LQLFLPPQPARVPVVICYPQNTYYTISAIFAASVGSHRQVIIWNGRFSVLFLFMLFVSVWYRTEVYLYAVGQWHFSMRCVFSFEVWSSVSKVNLLC